MGGALVPTAALGESRNAGEIGALVPILPAAADSTGAEEEDRLLMERQGRPPATEVEVWLAQELAFLYAVERRIQRRAALTRRSRWACAALLAASVCCSIWVLAGTVRGSG